VLARRGANPLEEEVNIAVNGRAFVDRPGREETNGGTYTNFLAHILFPSLAQTECRGRYRQRREFHLGPTRSDPYIPQMVAA
jgi:hypothetical protein